MNIKSKADLLLSEALHDYATDIHITPNSEKYLVQFRIYGKLSPIKHFSLDVGERLISHFKFMASMDIGETRKPQSGSLQTLITGLETSLRISTLPSAHSKESMAIRILPQQILSLKNLSLFPYSIDLLTSLMVQAFGMIIFTGPTGGGKSTSMYALAQYCTEYLDRHVISLEDPVEKLHDQLLQVQVNEKAGISFSTGLKAILRHDPDVILVGEIRDAETAMIAARAAMTGHLVLTSLHSRDAKGAIYRLLEFGIGRQVLEQILLAITAQRLVTINCPFCGMNCSKYCKSQYRPKRTGVYEILHGKTLLHSLKETREEEDEYHYETLQKLIRKGIALGYLPQEEYDRWIFEENKKVNI
ncbi:type II/IV secretion system protein [Bacillus sp. FJAT-49732]|uniref:Type II/IV secretion system protein n=1 Tax=Lederbergia citrisecunda TaxID=2833583 RepID=A0A942TL74_9BACI|nr:competence type IV pilus ATPase ComGA [Lederbergia citrisecunda]MBS4199660.1 type II/IV secretion system protein [Lederbergia citrisecunda]